MADRPQYPILVDGLDDQTAMVMGCNNCGSRRVYIDPDVFMEAVEVGRCVECGALSDYVMAYAEGARCENCQRVDEMMPVDNRFCSRACMLQAEYAQSLRAG